MSSEKPESKGKKEEERLYEPINNELERIFGRYVEKDKKQTYQSRPSPSPEERDVYLKITAYRRARKILFRKRKHTGATMPKMNWKDS